MYFSFRAGSFLLVDQSKGSLGNGTKLRVILASITRLSITTYLILDCCTVLCMNLISFVFTKKRSLLLFEICILSDFITSLDKCNHSCINLNLSFDSSIYCRVSLEINTTELVLVIFLRRANDGSSAVAYFSSYRCEFMVK